MSFFEKNISEMKTKKNILLDVLIICVDKLEDEISKNIFKDIQNYSRCTSKLPFVIFLTKKESNPDIEVFWELIKNNFLIEEMYLFFINFPLIQKKKL